MSSDVIHVHLVLTAENQLDTPESLLTDFINFTVNLVCDFIQKTVEDFIHCHQHIRSYLTPQRLRFDESVTIHRGVTDFSGLLANIRADGGHHVCFLSGGVDTTAISFFEHGIAVVALPKLNRHYKELLSCGSVDELRSIGLGVGAALHEIGHLLGAFHFAQGIMSEHSNAISLCYGDKDGSAVEAVEPIPFFDNFSACLFACGPFLNCGNGPSQSLSVRYKISKDTVYIKCAHGILLIVIVKGTTYHDLKLYNDLPVEVTLRIREECWDLIQVYNAFHCVENVSK
uniref:Peptidase M12B domain-containing protein n=1 Tax=Haemonchus contortus TaxID=6289 RepID=A0A7I4Y4F4_HAECO|nr:unnamed protein product [Haemonchus contortus]